MTPTPPPPSDKLPRRGKPRPPADSPPEEHPLGDLVAYDHEGTDLMPLPEGALDDLPPPPASAASSWLGREPLARDESDVIRGITQQPPPPGSSNIFDSGPGGSSRFTTPSGTTEGLTAEQPRPSNDVLYADLAQSAEPSGAAFSGDDLFGRPAGDSNLSRLPGDSSGGSQPNFNTTETGDEGSNLFADPTAADLDLDDYSGAVPLGAEPHSDADLARSGPGSSIFAGDTSSQGSALDVDHIPIMASHDEGRYEELPFDSPPPSGVGNDIFGSAGRPLRPSGIGAVAFDLPPNDPDATERSGGTVDLDLPAAPPSGILTSQRSRKVALSDLDPAVFGPLPTPTTTPAPRSPLRWPVEPTGLAPVFDTPPRRGAGAWWGGGAAGLLAGAGATAAGLYLGGFLPSEAPVLKPPPASALATQTIPGADPAELERVRKEAFDDRQRLTEQLNAAGRKATALQAELDKARLPDPELKATQNKLRDALAAVDAAKQEAATAAGKLQGTTQALAEATTKQQAAEEAVAGVVGAMKVTKLAGDADDPAAALAKLPAALRMATTADAQKAAAAVAAADARTAAVRAELAEAKKATEAATAAAMAARDELTAARAKIDERVKAAASEAMVKAGQDLEAARARETALRRQVDQAQQTAETVRTKMEEGYARQLADARSGATVPLSTTELRSRDQGIAELGRGMTAFFAGRTADAQGALEAATAANPSDARGWYFLGLARRRAGDGVGADAALRQGADLERRGRTTRRDVNEALLHVQGFERDLLRTYRP